MSERLRVQFWWRCIHPSLREALRMLAISLPISGTIGVPQDVIDVNFALLPDWNKEFQKAQMLGVHFIEATEVEIEPIGLVPVYRSTNVAYWAYLFTWVLTPEAADNSQPCTARSFPATPYKPASIEYGDTLIDV